MIYSYVIPAGGYALNGNIMAHSDSVMGDWAFMYDTLNRLVVGGAAANPSAPYPNTMSCWGYDSFGNRTLAAFLSSTTGDCSQQTTPTATYSAANQVQFVSQSAPISYSAPSGFIYDNGGSVTTDGVNSYAYDSEGRLCAVLQPSYMGGGQYRYIYDASGLRVAKASFTGSFPAKNTVCAAAVPGSNVTLTAQYLLNLGGEQVTELTGSGAWVHSNVWAGSHLDATYDTKGLHFQLADPLGTRRVQTNYQGVVEEYIQSLPFGDELNTVIPSGAPSTADDATEHHFTGKERDAESGNDYFGARYYSSAMGRFMSPDWSAKVEPVPYAKMDDPQSLNLYAYVGNNPLAVVDSDGHAPLSWGGFEDCGELGSCNNPMLAQQKQMEAQANQEAAKSWAQQQSLSAAGLKFIECHEAAGCNPNLTAYDASGKKHLGDWTIGYGHKIKPGEDFSKGITADQAAGLLSADVQTAVNAVNSALKYPTGSFQNEFDAMVSLAYNIGGTAFANSTLVQRWNSGGVVEQPDLFTRWSRTGGAFSPGLYARREDEYTLFNTGQY